MRVIFAGSSVHNADLDLTGIIMRRPAARGDVERAVHEGASVIGLIDGQFGQVASVWHKEILFALAQGVAVLGASSMGALRAAECQPFGMVPVGEIAWRYCRGELVDDADVALLMAPEELGYAPLTEPLVDAVATIAHLRNLGMIDLDEERLLLASARRLFFTERTPEAIFQNAGLGARTDGLLALYRRHHLSLKLQDALELISLVRDLPERRNQPAAWQIAASPFWTRRFPQSVTPL